MEEKEQRGFEDLECYQLALQVMREAYKVVQKLPPEEKFALGLQMRRASVSIGFNVAEGYGRYHYLDSLRFYYIARGSLDETLGGFIACDALGYTKASCQANDNSATTPCDLSMATSAMCVLNSKAARNTATALPYTKKAPRTTLQPSQPTMKSHDAAPNQFTNLPIYPYQENKP